MAQAFEWDEDKRLSNIDKHGIDFRDMRRLFDGRPVYTVSTPRDDEQRFATTGIVDARFFTVIWTPPNLGKEGSKCRRTSVS